MCAYIYVCVHTYLHKCNIHTETHCHTLMYRSFGIRQHHKTRRVVHQSYHAATHSNTLRCTTMHHAAPRCTTTQHAATRCNMLQHAAILCNTPTYLLFGIRQHHKARRFAKHDESLIHRITLQHTATRCNKLHHTATRCNTLQHTATRCNTLQHAATHCNTLQHADVPSLRNQTTW